MMAEENIGDLRSKGETHVSETGVHIMRRTVRDLAARHGSNENDIIAAMANHAIEDITGYLQLFVEFETSSAPSDEVIHLSESRAKLLKDPEYVLHFKQAQIERAYRQWVSNLKAWLPRS